MASSARERGFTLLEVLVAVAVLGLVVTILARTAIQGMGYEGDASRRLRASLIADRELAKIEAGLKLETPLTPGHQETQEGDDFAVSVDVEPVDLTQSGIAALFTPPEPKAGTLGSREQRTPPPLPVSPTVPRNASPNGLPPGVPPLALYRVLIRVGWVEGVTPLDVTRTTFAYDATAALQQLNANGQNGQGGQTGQTGSGSGSQSRSQPRNAGGENVPVEESP